MLNGSFLKNRASCNMAALMNCPLHEINRMSSKIDTLNDLPMHQHHVGPQVNIYILIQEQGEAHDGITWRPDIGILNQLRVLPTRLTQFALATQLEHCFHPKGQECY